MVNLTDDQVDKIREWAAQTRYVKEVRLFGSRAKGSARPDSDIDLAITVGGSDDGVVRGNYFAVGPEWQRQFCSG
jgi:predicted nucleotidyltransferase